MEITGKNFTHHMQYTSVLASLQHTGTVVICCINSRECTNKIYEHVIRQYQGRRGTVFLFHRCLTHSPQCSPHAAIAHRHIQPIPCQNIFFICGKAHTTFTIINVICPLRPDEQYRTFVFLPLALTTFGGRGFRGIINVVYL